MFGFFGYGIIGNLGRCTENYQKQCDIIDVMYNERGTTVVYKDIMNNAITQYDNSIDTLRIAKSGNLQVMCIYDKNHYSSEIYCKYKIISSK